MYLAVVFWKMFLLIDQSLLWLRQPVLFALALHANLEPVRKSFQSTQLQKKSTSSTSIWGSCEGTFKHQSGFSHNSLCHLSLPHHITVFL